MIRINVLAVCLSIPLVALHPSPRSCDGGELMPPDLAARLGLEEVWRRQMRVPAGTGSIVDQQIVVHHENPREVVEVVVGGSAGKADDGEAANGAAEAEPEAERQPGGEGSGEEPQDQPPDEETADASEATNGEDSDADVLFRIRTDLPGPDGEPIGKEEAERLARREVRRLKRKGIEPTIRTRSVPRVHLYTASDNGAIDCRDAETGTPIWMAQVGRPRLKYGKMGINDKFLTITNGGNLIQLEIETGEPIETIRTTSMPLYGALNAGDWALVPTIRNGVEGYPLSDITRKPFMEIVAGLALEPPTKSPTSSRVAWATDREFVYVMELSGEPTVLFRLNTEGIVSGRLAAASGNRFFFASEGGQVYALRATRTGEVIWNQPYGEPFYQTPFLLEGLLLLPSVYGNLYAIDMETGYGVWNTPARNVKQILGAIGDRIFVRFLSGSFGAVNLESGRMELIDNSMKPGRMIVNRVTDRLYFIDDIGTVQCLRPVGQEMPNIRTSQEAMTSPEEDETEPQQEQAEQKPEPGGDDPFGAPAADPFGAPADDPFGGGNEGGAMPADPFGGGGGGQDDPFGGDPFGN